MTEEIWKPVTGYEGLYEVSDLGRVRRLPTGKQWPYRMTHNNIRKPSIKNGYYVVNLSKGNKVRWMSVHRLVALAFIPNPNGLPCVNHKDENRLNNCADNLEWCTYKYNANYGLGREKQKASRASNPNDYISRKRVGELNSRPVEQFSINGESIARYKSIYEASRITGIHMSTIIRQCKERVKYARKFRFKYV